MREYKKNCKGKEYEGYAREDEWEGREGEESAAAWCAIRRRYLEWLTSAFLISRSVSACKVRQYCCLFICFFVVFVSEFSIFL